MILLCSTSPQCHFAANKSFVVVNFILHCNRCGANRLCVGFPQSVFPFPPIPAWGIIQLHLNAALLSNATDNKKLIRRWDSERELILQRHRIHALQNTIDSCINSARDRCCYVLEHRFTKVSKITLRNGHYAVQGHSRSLILVPTESSYTTSYYSD